MNYQELLVVSDAFQLTNIGLTLAPCFGVPAEWKNVQAKVLIAGSDGVTVQTVAQFNLTHFSSPSPDHRWRIFVSLPELSKELVPLGSRLLAPADLVAKLAPLVDLRPSGDSNG